jgi:hypothetical protein
VAASNYSNTDEHDELVSTLTSLGYGTVDVMDVAEAEAAEADVIIAYIGCYKFDTSDLDVWISSGKGYIQIGDWTDWFSNDYELIGDATVVNISITNPTHPIAQGLPSSWTGLGFWAYGYDNDYVGWTSGYTEVGKLEANGYAQHDEGISVREYGTGRTVYFGFNVYGSSVGQNELTLLSNAVNWIAKVDLSSLTISPPSGTYVTTQGFDITLILEASGLSMTGGSVTLDGSDVTSAFASRLVSGTLISGGKTFRCPKLSGGTLGTGTHTFDVTLDLSDGSSVNDSVTWEVKENTEP